MRKTILSIIMFLSILSLFSFPVNVQAQEKEKFTPTEIIAQRTENSKTIQTGEKTFSFVSSIGPIHYKDDYKDDKEQWKEISLEMKDGKLTTAPYELTIDGLRVVVLDKKTGSTTQLELTDIGDSKTMYTAIETPKLDFSVKGKATAKDVATGTDLEISWDNSRVSYTRILKSSNASTIAKYSITETGTTKIPLLIKSQDSKEGTNKTVEVTSEIKDGVLTESIDTVNINLTYPVRIDPTLDISVGSSTDDCRVIPDIAYSFIDLDDSSIYVGRTPMDPSNHAGYRFVNILIPPLSGIDSSYVSFTASSSTSGATANLNIYGDDVDDSATFSTLSNFNGRSKTTEVVAWNSISSWTAETVYDSPEIKTIVQEIVDREGWASGNDISILVYDNASTASAFRQSYAYDGSAIKSPALHIDYTVYDDTTSRDSTGLGMFLMGAIETSHTYETGLDAYEIENSGNVAIDISIGGTDMLGGVTWTLSNDASIGTNIYGMKAGVEGGDYTIVIDKSSTNLLKSDLAANAKQKFGLKFYAPSVFTDGVTKSGTVIFTDVEH